MARIVTQEEWTGWYRKVYAYFFRRLDQRLDVEELTASTLQDFFSMTEEIQHENGFMWTIARRKFQNFLKAKRREKIQVLDWEFVDQANDEYDCEYQDRLLKLQECMSKQLKPIDQEIVELCIMSDFNSNIVSEKLNISAQNVRQRLSRALKKLRRECLKVWKNDYV